MDDGTLAEEVRDARREVRQMMRIPPADRGVLDQMPKDELVARLRRAMLTTIALDEEVLAKAKLLEDARHDLRAEKRHTKALGDRITALEDEAKKATAAREAVERLLEDGTLELASLRAAGWPYDLPVSGEEDVAAARAKAEAEGLHLYWMTTAYERSAFDAIDRLVGLAMFAASVPVVGVDRYADSDLVDGWVMTTAPVPSWICDDLGLVADADVVAPTPDDAMPAYARGVMTPRPMTHAERLQAEIESELRRQGAMPH